MRRKVLITCLLAAGMTATAAAHDLFLKLDAYFLRPHEKATVRLMNGTFAESEAVVARARLRDVRVVTPRGGVSRPEAGAWRDERNTTLLEVQTAGPGTYVVGLSTMPREIDLKAEQFNDYLEHDGLPDVLAVRRKNGELGKGVRERYSKHVRAVFQVGNERTDDYKKPLGYPVEIIPQRNPYDLRAGQTLEVLCTLEGKPLVDQFVIGGYEPLRGAARSTSTRTDRKGVARFKLTGTGNWYVKMIHMIPLKEPGVDYESKWATLTFGVK